MKFFGFCHTSDTRKAELVLVIGKDGGWGGGSGQKAVGHGGPVFILLPWGERFLMASGLCPACDDVQIVIVC